MKTASYAAHALKETLQQHTIERRALKSNDVLIEIEYCGVCHTDLHFVNNDWGMTEYPVVPGHEIVGRISQIGSEVGKFKVGDLAAIGCMVNSCGQCSSCESGNEQYCLNGFTATYNAPIDDPGE